MSVISCTVDRIGEFSSYFYDIINGLCREGSDFQRKLSDFASGDRNPTADDGYFSLVKADERIVGWARSEIWVDEYGDEWDTLEAFVVPYWRGRGIASLAASGLAAKPLWPRREIAVFSPPMMLIARNVGLRPVLFSQEPATLWKRQHE